MPSRLVLADAMWYCQERYKPHTLIDLAADGAIIVPLDNDEGIFANDDDICEKLTAAGKLVGEPVWQIPLGDAYDKLVFDIADMKNIGGRWVFLDAATLSSTNASSDAVSGRISVSPAWRGR